MPLTPPSMLQREKPVFYQRGLSVQVNCKRILVVKQPPLSLPPTHSLVCSHYRGLSTSSMCCWKRWLERLVTGVCLSSSLPLTWAFCFDIDTQVCSPQPAVGFHLRRCQDGWEACKCSLCSLLENKAGRLDSVTSQDCMFCLIAFKTDVPARPCHMRRGDVIRSSPLLTSQENCNF